MTSGGPFNSRRDEELGALLRSHLDGERNLTAFTERVLGGLSPASSLWEVLARWTRPGIAAAVLATVAAGYWLALNQGDQTDPEPAAEVAATDHAPDRDVLVSLVLGNVNQ